jgi:hypothetical protein
VDSPVTQGGPSRYRMTESWRDRIVGVAVDPALSLPMILSWHDSVCVCTKSLRDLRKSFGFRVFRGLNCRFQDDVRDDPENGCTGYEVTPSKPRVN